MKRGNALRAAISSYKKFKWIKTKACSWSQCRLYLQPQRSLTFKRISSLQSMMSTLKDTRLDASLLKVLLWGALEVTCRAIKESLIKLHQTVHSVRAKLETIPSLSNMTTKDLRLAPRIWSLNFEFQKTKILSTSIKMNNCLKFSMKILWWVLIKVR